MNDDEPYFKSAFENGYLVDICRTSIRSSEESEAMPKEKISVLYKLLGESQHFLFCMGNEKEDQKDNVLFRDFTGGK